MHASSALRRALAAQILSSDSSLQQAALKGLKVPYLARHPCCIDTSPNAIDLRPASELLMQWTFSRSTGTALAASS